MSSRPDHRHEKGVSKPRNKWATARKVTVRSCSCRPFADLGGGLGAPKAGRQVVRTPRSGLTQARDKNSKIYLADRNFRNNFALESELLS
jgi:hypothetical protein